MGEKMSLQQVRDALLDGELYIATGGHDGKLLGQSAMLRLANAIDARLTQPAQAVDDDTLLDVARRVGLRQQLTGINSDDAKFLLRAFVAALPNANGKEG